MVRTGREPSAKIRCSSARKSSGLRSYSPVTVGVIRWYISTGTRPSSLALTEAGSTGGLAGLRLGVPVVRGGAVVTPDFASLWPALPPPQAAVVHASAAASPPPSTVRRETGRPLSSGPAMRARLSLRPVSYTH